MTYLLIAGAVVLAWLLLGGSRGRSLRIGTPGRGLQVGSRDIEFEAKLRQVSGGPIWMASGKAERELHRDGREDFELWCSLQQGSGRPNFPADAVIEVVLEDTLIATVPVRHGRASLELRSWNGDEVPEVQEGTRLTIRYEGEPILEGVFHRD